MRTVRAQVDWIREKGDKHYDVGIMTLLGQKTLRMFTHVSGLL